MKLRVMKKVDRELVGFFGGGFFLFVSPGFERYLYSTDSKQIRYSFTPCVTKIPGAAAFGNAKSLQGS